MAVDSDFLEPLHESMEVNSAQPNIVAGPSQITILLSNSPHVSEDGKMGQ